MNHLYVKQFLVVSWEFYMSKWGCYLVLSIRVMRKVPQKRDDTVGSIHLLENVVFRAR